MAQQEWHDGSVISVGLGPMQYVHKVRMPALELCDFSDDFGVCLFFSSSRGLAPSESCSCCGVLYSRSWRPQLWPFLAVMVEKKQLFRLAGPSMLSKSRH
jgi:hypothetical protein